jgi:hypothetical protein
MRKLCAHNDRRYYLRELSRRELLTQVCVLVLRFRAIAGLCVFSCGG